MNDTHMGQLIWLSTTSPFFQRGGDGQFGAKVQYLPNVPPAHVCWNAVDYSCVSRLAKARFLLFAETAAPVIWTQIQSVAGRGRGQNQNTTRTLDEFSIKHKCCSYIHRIFNELVSRGWDGGAGPHRCTQSGHSENCSSDFKTSWKFAMETESSWCTFIKCVQHDTHYYCHRIYVC